MDTALKRFIIVVLIVLLSFVIALLGPVYSYIVDGNRSTLLSVRLPFVEKDSSLEFTLLLIIQTIYGFVLFNSNIALESAYNLDIDALRTPAELIKMEIDNLSYDLDAENLTTIQIRKKLLSIFYKIHHSDRYYSNEIDIF